MNNTYKTNKTDWRRLGRNVLLVALLLGAPAAQAQVSGGKVTLDDRENHSWSYYSDASLPELLRSLNPADVQIIYHGNGQKTISTTNGATPANNSWTQNATTVKVSATEADSVFIYYKTLERTDGSTSETPTGRCKYTTIANPFSVRPTYQYANGDLDKYCGFYAWRVVRVSGGTIYDAATNGNAINAGGTINAETDIYFAPTASTGMVVELEALWAKAYVVNSNTTTGLSADVTYERNFVYLTSNTTLSNSGLGRQVTYTTLDPATGTGTKRTITFGNGTRNYFRCQTATKFENSTFASYSNNTYLSAGGNYLVVGRGCTGTLSRLYGLHGNSTNNFRFRIESGIYSYLYFMGTNAVTTGHMTAIMGCDYDRAKGTNTNLRVTTDILMSSGGTAGSTGTLGTERIHCTVKSGNYDLGSYGGDVQFYMSSPGQNNYAKRTLVIEGGNFSDVSGGMESNATSVGDHLMFELRIKGGTINGPTYGAAQNAAGGGNRKFIITGGEFKSWIAGGANGTNTTGGKLSGKTYIYFGGTASCNSNGSPTTYGPGNATGGNIFGAGSGNAGAGTNATVGEVDQSTVIIADECLVERNVYGGGNYGYVVGTGATNKSEMYILGGTVNGSVFGGSNMQKGNIVNYTIKGGTVKGGVYGGSNARGTLSGGVTMAISGGTMQGGVYGGGYGTNTESCNVSGAVNITMTGGTVLTGLYGGGNVRSVITGTTTVNVNGGTIGASGTPAGVYGGGLGQNTRANNSVTVNIGAQNANTGATIYGDVYGGSAKGVTNYTGSAANGSTAVTLNAGTIYGSLYGGGHGLESANAHVYGAVTVNVYGGKVKPQAWDATNPASVFGCNNAAGSPQSTVSVTVNATDATTTDGSGNKVYAINGVYGGGNEADYTYTPANNTNSPTVTVIGCTSSIKDVYGGGNAASVPQTYVTINGGDIDRVFGGGNGERGANYPAHVGRYTANTNTYGTGNTNVAIHGGTINQVFGGSNSNGEIKGSINVGVSNNSSGCPIAVHSLYSGGNMAPSDLGTITVGCMAAGDMIDTLFCGANQADITGNVNFTMTGGRIGNLFGGNNKSGNVSGSITLTVNWTTGNEACANNYLGNVFGGGNLATFGTAQSPKAPTVKILNGNVSGNVYGGGKGDPNDHTKGQVTGNPVVTIGDATAGHESYKAIVSGSVFGGGDAGNVSGTPVVNVVEKCNTVITTAVYGGGNAADVTGTNVTINGGTIGDVFGGGNGQVAAADVTGSTSLTIHGGTITHVFAGGNKSGTINNNTGVTIDHTSSCDQSIAEVYGGGNEAAGKAGTVSIACSAENIGDVYGGANKANVTNDITLNITGGQINNVFGGNNTSGSISGGITVNVNKATNCSTFSVNNVYGGGNLAQYTIPNNKALAVNILNGTVSQNVYGGGKGDPNDHSKGQVTGNPVVTIGDANNLNNNNIVAAVTGDVYGGGDAGNVVGIPVVNVINKCNTTIGNVYGGGNAADVNGTDVNIDGGIITGMVFGGGHGDKDATPPKQADVNGNVAVDITGGTIAKVFGGSNSKGTISGTVAVNIEKDANSCEMHITEVYGGGNQAAGNAGTLTIGCTGGATEGIGDVYGGAREANINSDITLNITGGKINNVFGGNNISGSISGGITVNVNWTGNTCAQNSLQNVYGGGNLAQYTVPNNKALAVNILNGTVSQNVYGGGKGDPNDHTKGQVTGNPVVTIGDVTSGHESYVATVGGDVYGGGDAGNVVGTPVVTIPNKSNTSVVNVYGGGNAADVSSTDVSIYGGQISGMVFGGGHGDKDASPQKQADVKGNVAVKVYGGTISQVFGGANSKGDITGSVAVTVNKSNAPGAADMKIGEVYGGGNFAAGNAGAITIGCTGTWTSNHDNANTTDNRIGYELEGVGTVFGGANRADIGTAQRASNITVNIYSGIVNTVFGGNNNDGDIYGTITVNIAKNANTCSWYVGNVYGGGFNAAYSNAAANNPAVNVSAGKVTYNVYGGGKGAGAVVTGNPTVTLSGTAEVGGNVYGGGDAAAVDGNTNVILRD